MVLHIDLDPVLHDRLRRQATLCGVETEQYVKQLIETHVDIPATTTSVAELFAQWAKEDATDDPAELDRRRQEWEELKRAMNENHPSERVLFP